MSYLLASHHTPDSFSFNGVVIEKRSIQQDVRDLVLSYLSLDTCSFKSFRSLWQKKGFVLIHYICTVRSSRSVFLEYIYSVILSYLYISTSPSERAAVVYSLFLLYFSEPVSAENLIRLPIPITPSLFQELKESYKLFATDDLFEPLYALRHLFQSNAFAYLQNKRFITAPDDAEHELNLPTYTSLSVSAEIRNTQTLAAIIDSLKSPVIDATDLESLETSTKMYSFFKEQLLVALPTHGVDERPEELSLFDDKTLCDQLKSLI